MFSFSEYIDYYLLAFFEELTFYSCTQIMVGSEKIQLSSYEFSVAKLYVNRTVEWESHFVNYKSSPLRCSLSTVARWW